MNRGKKRKKERKGEKKRQEKKRTFSPQSMVSRLFFAVYFGACSCSCSLFFFYIMHGIGKGWWGWITDPGGRGVGDDQMHI